MAEADFKSVGQEAECAAFINELDGDRGPKCFWDFTIHCQLNSSVLEV